MFSIYINSDFFYEFNGYKADDKAVGTYFFVSCSSVYKFGVSHPSINNLHNFFCLFPVTNEEKKHFFCCYLRQKGSRFLHLQESALSVIIQLHSSVMQKKVLFYTQSL